MVKKAIDRHVAEIVMGEPCGRFIGGEASKEDEENRVFRSVLGLEGFGFLRLNDVVGNRNDPDIGSLKRLEELVVLGGTRSVFDDLPLIADFNMASLGERDSRSDFKEIHLVRLCGLDRNDVPTEFFVEFRQRLLHVFKEERKHLGVQKFKG